jgi:formylglycine-generating enzyme required for sulfatase activity
MRDLNGDLALATIIVLASLSFACSSSPSAMEDTIVPDVGVDISVGCSSTADCEDNNPCTKDSCLADGMCDHTVLVGITCDDGNACTAEDACGGAGECTGATNLTCDDSNSCTDDACDPEIGCIYEKLTAEVECDGALCSVGDLCEEGVCLSGDSKVCEDTETDDCVYYECNPGTGLCDKEQFQPKDHPCKDGNPCTDNDECNGGDICLPGAPHECNAGNPCKKSACNETKCKEADGCNPCDMPTWKNEGVGCNDGDACSENDACVSVGDGPELNCSGVAVDCNDGNSCTADSCDEEAGCQFEQKSNGSPCDLSSEYCGAKGSCLEGECTAEDVKICDDDLDCTDDSCSGDGECVHSPVDSNCDDGLYCNGLESCSAESGCQNGEAPLLDDGVECTVDGCDEENALVTHTVDPSLCDDADVCNGAETCDAAQGCLAGEALVCDDEISCTEDSCDAVAGCVFAPVDIECDSGDVCSADSCDVETGCAHVAFPDGGSECCAEDDDCDDANICTDDTCGIDFHCQYVNKDDGAECTDGLKCTLDDACLNGQCTGSANDCDDGLDCTVDSCDGDAGCVNTPDSDFCDDENVCTGTEECDTNADGPGTGCKAIDPLDCDDEVTCTFDGCDAVDGCSSVPQDGTCDDNNPCTLDVCDDEQDCLHTFIDGSDEDTQCCVEEDAECSDGIPCTKDTCNLDTHQCEAAAMANGQGCSPNDLCKLSGVCQNGTCEAPDKVCEDNVACTTNGCEPDTGCTYVGSDQYCDDENDCTSESCNIDDDCVYVELDGQECDDGNAGTVDDICAQDLCSGLPDPDGDGIANEGYEQVCTVGQTQGCNDNCPAVPNGDQADEDGNGVGDVCDGNNVALDLYEPCADISPAFKDGACESAGPAYEDHTSSWQRTDEPFELPLVNGILDDSVEAYWKCNGDFAEESGIDATTLSGEPWGIAGFDPASDGAMRFDGNDDAAHLWKDRDYRFWDDYTVSFWMRLPAEKPDNIGALVVIDSGDKCHDNTGAGSGFGLHVEPDGKLHYMIRWAGAAHGECTVETPADGEWHHVAGVRRGNQLSLYLDGNLADSQSAGNVPAENDCGNWLSLASEWHYVDKKYYKFLEVDIDELLVIDRAITPLESSTLYSSHKPFGFVLAPGSQADFDDIRVTEAGEAVLSELSGPRPHSDTPCPYAGDWPGDVWVDEGSGLMWMKQPVAGGSSWSSAKGSCQGLTLGGYDDWRLPTISESRSILRACAKSGMGSPDCGVTDLCAAKKCSSGGDGVCEGCAANQGPGGGGCYWPGQLLGECAANYWSSTEVAGDAWIVDFKEARLVVSHTGQAVAAGTRCVRDAVDVGYSGRDDLCGVEAYWKFDGDASDITGQHDGISVGALAKTGRFGEQDSGLLFGGNSYVDANTVFPLSDTDSLTVEAWFQCEGGGDLFSAQDGGEFRMVALPSATSFAISGSGSEGDTAVTPTGFCDGNWHHIAGVRDAGVAMNRLYVDGTLLAQKANPNLGTLNPSDLKPVLGARRRTATIDNHFDGSLDEVIVHAVAKSPDYIYRRANPGLPSVRFLVDTEQEAEGETYEYNKYTVQWGDEDSEHVVPLVDDVNNVNGGKPCAGLLSPCNGYMGWWRFNEGGGTVAVDSSTLKHNGVLGLQGAPDYADGVPTYSGTSDGTGLLFDGQDDAVVVEGFPAWNSGESNTVESLIRRDSGNSLDSVVANSRADGCPQFQLYFHTQPPGPTDGLSWYLASSNCASGAHIFVSEKKDPGDWMVAGVSHVFGSAETTLLRDYQPQLDSGYQGDGEPLWDPLQSTVLTIGNRLTPDQQFEGVIDSVRIMNRVLETDELLHHPLTKAMGLAYVCAPDCTNKQCGDDGCGGSCGECQDELVCFLGQCADEGFAHIKAGGFWMGSPEGCPGPEGYGGDCTSEPGREPWDSGSEELHYVKLTGDFEIQAHEVTQGEWKAAFGGWNPAGSTNGDSYPIETVSWFDGCAYANYRSELAGLTPCYVFDGVECAEGDNPADATDYAFCLDAVRGGIGAGTVTLADGASKPYACQGFRLPTDAEWEYAARAGSTTAFYPSAGNDGSITETGCDLDANLDMIGWYCGNNDPTGTKEVGEKAGNNWGLKDMSGNVWEWTWDKYCTDNTSYGDDPDAGNCGGSGRVARGNSWNDNAGYCRSASRYGKSPDSLSSTIGFRLARSLE